MQQQEHDLAFNAKINQNTNVVPSEINTMIFQPTFSFEKKVFYI